MSEPRNVVIVEDDYLCAEYLRLLCDSFGVSVAGRAQDAATARTLIGEAQPTHVLMDVRLIGDEDGVDVAKWVHRNAPDTRVVFVTASSEPPTMERINSDHPHRVLIKPIAPEALRESLR